MKATKITKIILAILAVGCLALLGACTQDTPQGNTVEERAFNGLTKEEQDVIKEATPSEVLYSYFQFINDGMEEFSVALTDPGTLEGVETVEEAIDQYFKGYTVEVIHMEAVNDDIRQTDANNTHFLMLVEVTTDEDATTWDLGIGEQVLYAHLRQTRNGWRIHSFDLAQ